MSGDGCPALPGQPAGVSWPEGDWPRGEPAGDGTTLGAVDDLLADVERCGETRSLLVVQGGRLVVERYQGAERDEPMTAATTVPSWSMAKSMLHSAVGVLVGDGRLDPSDRVVDVAPGAVAAWAADPEDGRRAVTVDDLLHMRAGLAWTEDYTPADPAADPAATSDVVAMLYGPGRPDTAAFAAAKPLVDPPGSRAAYRYSSGTSNVLAAVVREVLGPDTPIPAWLDERLFEPTGMTSAQVKVDAAGTWIASTYCFATPRDLARFGLLVLRDGTWRDRRLLPAGWVDHGRTPQADVLDDGWRPGAHWWGLPARPDLFFANGYRGQYLLISPTRDAVVLRTGVSAPTHRDAALGRLLAIESSLAARAVPGSPP